MQTFNPIAPRKAKIVFNFGLSECKWVRAAGMFVQPVRNPTLIFGSTSYANGSVPSPTV